MTEPPRVEKRRVDAPVRDGIPDPPQGGAFLVDWLGLPRRQQPQLHRAPVRGGRGQRVVEERVPP